MADIEEPIMDWKFYFYPANATKIMASKTLIFSIVLGVYYLIQFCACVSSVNFYSDNARMRPCITTGEDGVIVETKTGEEASMVLDTPIMLLAIYHIIEWVRCTIFLTAVCLGVNMMQVWYVMGLNSLYGLVVFLYAHAVYFSEIGVQCGTDQVFRYQWLMAEIILFWVTFFTFVFPPIIMRFMGKEKVHIQLYKPEEEEGSDSE